MDYLTHFVVECLDDPAIIASLKKELLTLEGVSEVQILGVNRVSVIHDPTKVYLSKLTVVMRSVGVRTRRG